MAFWDKKKPSTLEEVKKAYENLSDDDKKSFHDYQQSIADRVHESIAAQEREHGQEDSQSAEAREHEALGEEHAEGKGDVEELHESDDMPEEKAEDKADEAREDAHEERQDDGLRDRIAALEDQLAKLQERFGKGGEDEAALRRAEEIYGLGHGVFSTERKEEKGLTPKEAAEIVKNLKR